MENLIKRKWTIWLWVLAIKPIIDIVMLFFISDRVSINHDYDSLSSFIAVSIILSVVLFVFVFIGTIIYISRIFGDRRYEIKYRFWTMGFIALLTAIINTVAGVFYDIAEFGLVYVETEGANGQVIGHGAPAFTIVFALIGCLYVIVAGIAGIILQAAYSSKKK